MLSDAPSMLSNVSISFSTVSTLCYMCCKKHHSHLQVLSVNLYEILPELDILMFLLLTLLSTAGYSQLPFALLNISLSHLLLLSAMNPNACRATGRGLQPKGVRVKEVADFKVFTKGAGSGELHVSVKGPSESDSSLFSASLPTPPHAFLELFPLFGFLSEG